MEEQNYEQITPQAQPVATDSDLGEKTGDISLGKFKDVNALLSAYNSLQSEFTKRCQKIKELEGVLATYDKEKSPEVAGSVNEDTNQTEDTTLQNKDEILKEYLQGVLSKKPKAIVIDGVGAGVKAPINKPRTIIDAGNLAKELFTK